MEKEVNKKAMQGQQKNLVPAPQQNVTGSGAKRVSSESNTDIEKAAYYRWVNRGRTHGNDQKDWFEAEKNFKNKK